jgi:hypothetical protein
MRYLEFYINDLSGKYLKYLSEDLKSEIIGLTPKCSGIIRERLYWIRNSLTDYPICKCCGNKLSSKNFITNGKVGYRDYCGIKCCKKSQQYDIIIAKRETTNVERYGSNNPCYFPKFREFIKNKYNVDFILEEEEKSV